MDLGTPKKVYEIEDALRKVYDKYEVYGISIFDMEGDLRLRTFNIAPPEGSIRLLEKVLEIYKAKLKK